MNVYSVIMAGGGGTRFWPISRMKKPKQLLNLSGKETLINETINRISVLSKKENIFIVTNTKQSEPLKDIVKDLCLDENILLEPYARNTAAAIGYAAIKIRKREKDGIMCVFPADHFIEDVDGFKSTFEKAIYVAEKNDKLVTIGVEPRFPSTGYGYIKYDKNSLENKCYDVKEFVEKPNYEKALSYIESKEYLWNSGMFVWKASKILDEIQRFLPKLYSELLKIEQILDTESEENQIEKIYANLISISIDYGVLERSDSVTVVKGDLDWNDVGSWDILGSLYKADEKGNIARGNTINIDTSNSIIFSSTRLVSTIGLKDMIVVETDDAILVCKKDEAQRVKEVVEKLKDKNMDEYL